jgi:hypothetical protein
VRRTKVETDKMEKNIMIAISVLSASYCRRRVHQKKYIVSGPGTILKSTASEILWPRSASQVNGL